MAQQDTTRKILEELQEKKQLLQKGVLPIVLTTSTEQLKTVQSTEVIPSTTGAITPNLSQRSAFNLNNSAYLGYFIPQDSHYGNTFIPVLPRF